MTDNDPHFPDAAGRRPSAPVRPHLITSDQEALEVACRLAERFVLGASERDARRLLPWDEVDEYTASGLGGMTIPKTFGGAEVSNVTLAKVFEILCAADPALGQIPQNQFGVLALLKDVGSDAHKVRIFGDVLNGFRIGNAGPEKKTNSVAVSTTILRSTADGLRLTGRRFYSTGAIFAHWIPTRAIDDEGRAVQVWAAYNAPGVTVIDDWSSFGQRTTASGSVEFADVPIDPGLVFPVWSYADRPGLAGPISQLVQASIDLGIAAAAVGDAMAFVRDRARPWVDSGVSSATDDPTIIHSVGSLYTDLHAAQATLYEAAETIDRVAQEKVTDASSALASVAVAEAKILTTEIALAATEQLFDLAGSASTREAHNLGRHWRNARVHTLHDPVRWKYHLLGKYELTGAYPARHQWN
ncbi:sulfur acquisition oxidoreductase SfnB family protein (plasmid) [Rhizobium etli bv. mimosae str. IE4771]|uniref:Sulfur acquisition oxidoreductase SfnB family protein n=1 Tax=Rhizobium etli bv. mimosae str. IE4771 TaxID=1432050 RepID=A0A060I8Q9_RHIET|nr:SfnB family sulfur acquisition oxidoreductase [Rhizobium sp. IE4771]AIC31353.1 sulfur acquisition oxidoreductase SfnB family protein [Rhizobium sp. IE4771]